MTEKQFMELEAMTKSNVNESTNFYQKLNSVKNRQTNAAKEAQRSQSPAVSSKQKPSLVPYEIGHSHSVRHSRKKSVMPPSAQNSDLSQV